MFTSMLAEQRPDLADDARTVDVGEEHHVLRGRDLDLEAVHLRDSLVVRLPSTEPDTVTGSPSVSARSEIELT